MTTSLITGISGQDGPYLAAHLHEHGRVIWGASRTGQIPAALPFVRPCSPMTLEDAASVDRAIALVQPDEVYHLAAQSSVAASWADPTGAGDATGLGAVRMLEAVRRHAPSARLFIAASSEIFGTPTIAPQDESTPIAPVSPYGAAKAYAMHVARSYRQNYGLFVSVGILYNHESPLRPYHYVTQKIAQGAASIARGEQTELRLGNLESRRDWGFAGDYVRAMRLMLEQPEPSDFVVATGQTHSVGDFCQAAFDAVGLDWRQHVVSDPAFIRPGEPYNLVGDASKARRVLGWEPLVRFEELVHMMVGPERASVT